WVRRTQGTEFQVFAVNCAHLGCPVRWFPQSNLFLCPCHGGAYYADGARAAGPPPRGLFRYDIKVENDRLFIKAGMMPTLGNVIARREDAAPAAGCTPGGASCA
ncbi:MAG TPA: Rieske 2Fe-2S domain-containing protein, partial [Thermoanaerobaculia bacterium]